MKKSFFSSTLEVPTDYLRLGKRTLKGAYIDSRSAIKCMKLSAMLASLKTTKLNTRL